MSSSTLAYFSNDAIYACLAIFTIAFLAHAFEVSWSVKNTDSDDKTQFDFSRTDRAGRLGTAMMILGTTGLVVADLTRGLSAHRVPWGNMYEFSITGALMLSAAYM